MILLSVILLSATLLCGEMAFAFENSVCYSLAITFGTAFYHIAMRLAVGAIVDGIKHNRFDYTKKWFQELKFEKYFYEAIRIKSWKNKIPTFVPKQFDVSQHSIEDIAMATCQAEIVHEIIMVLSFIPVLFSRQFGALWVFLITSILAAFIDLVFVLLQRFNRPRLLKLIHWTGR